MNKAAPNLLVIVGVSGDLSRRMLIPALYHLEQDDLLPEEFVVVGTSRREMKLEDLRAETEEFIRGCDDGCDEASLDRFFKRFVLMECDPAKPDGADALAARLSELEAGFDACVPRLFYLAIPPNAIAPVATGLGRAEVQNCNHAKPGRLLIEKPFGRDSASAQSLIDELSHHFNDSQIFRIDHFLAKETVQNILHFRFHNPLVRDIWNSKFIDHVQITVAEDIGIEDRVDFYEQTGALRDMIQSHVLQLVAVTAMAEPPDLSGPAIRAAREAVLSQLKAVEDVSASAVRGQYEGYKDEVKNPDSTVETYAALKVEIDNDRWRNTPIYVRSGKRIATKLTEINLIYSDEPKEHTTNVLTIRIQPNEGIALTLYVKKPGFDSQKQEVIMDYCYDVRDQAMRHDAYEKLLLDAMNGDQTLFPSASEVMNNWRYVEPVLQAWEADKSGPYTYQADSWGPEAAEALLQQEHIDWIKHNKLICTPRWD